MFGLKYHLVISIYLYYNSVILLLGKIQYNSVIYSTFTIERMHVKWKWKYHYRMQLLHVSSVTCFFTNSEQISLKWTSIVILAPRMFLISFGISWRTRAAKFVKFWVKWMVKGPCNEIRVHGWEHSSNCIWNILWTSPHDKGKVFVSPQIEFTCCLPVQIHPWKLRTYLIWSQKNSISEVFQIYVRAGPFGAMK